MPFDACRLEKWKATSLSLVRLKTTNSSMPPEYAYRDVTEARDDKAWLRFKKQLSRKDLVIVDEWGTLLLRPLHTSVRPIRNHTNVTRKGYSSRPLVVVHP